MILKDKVAVVTGSGQGMGKAIAIELAQAGAKDFSKLDEGLTNLKELIKQTLKG